MIDISGLSDEELVEMVRTVDQDLYRHVMERYQAALLRYATSIVRDGDMAADVVQNAFIKAFVNLNSFKARYKFSPWLYRITHNEAVNWLKKHAKEVNTGDDWFARQLDTAPGLLELVDTKLRRQQLASALAQLDLKYRQPLVLYYWQGLGYEEIATVLRLPTSSVGTRMRRGKAQLRELLAKEGIEDA
jgi:RNA polymerase sigma-70 factor, ECF subfamily